MYCKFKMAILCGCVVFGAPRATCVKGGFHQLNTALPHDYSKYFAYSKTTEAILFSSKPLTLFLKICSL